MSLVGPRPEVPRYVELWPPADRELILSVRPGLTDYAALYFYDEQALLAGAPDPEKAYVDDILPRKLEFYREYVKVQSAGLDIRLILSTLARMVRGQGRSPEGRANLFEAR
jgi:lipopolysaccharide/colanic/teichoic acid biosynthesis glycosyltransferase